MRGCPAGACTAALLPLHPALLRLALAQYKELALAVSWSRYYDLAEAHMDLQWDRLLRPLLRSCNFSAVLEVAAGRCRNTEKLLPLAGSVIATDISSWALARCGRRFAGRPEAARLRLLVVDGDRVPLPDRSVTLVYQFDAGVHFPARTVRRYMEEFARVLTPGGMGLFHHSNLGASGFPVRSDRDPSRNRGSRANMTRSAFASIVKALGLELVCHPLVDWHGGLSRSLDALALFRKPGPGPAGPAGPCPPRLVEPTGALA